MRNLLTSTIASVALATLLAGSAAAADMNASSAPTRTSAINQAEQDQLDRDSTQRWQQRAPLGVVVVPGDQSTADTSRLDQDSNAGGSSAWLDRSPHGQTLNQAALTPNQAAELRESQDD